MAKTRTVFVCQECGKNSPRELGKCPACGSWNSFVEEIVAPAGAPTGGLRTASTRSEPRRLSEISGEDWQRIPLPIEEFSRVLGGGVVPGSIVLIGGEPGIGKCLAASERVLDPQTGAFLPITEWAESNRPVLSVNPDTLRLGQDRVLAFYNQGVKPIVEVKTRLGRTLRCTANHPLLTNEGWKPVSDLGKGDRIAAPRALPYFGNHSMPDEHVKLIAYILSDGSAQSVIAVTSMLPEVEDDLKQIADYFGMRLKTYEKKNNRAKQYRFTNNRYARAGLRKELATKLREAHQQTDISLAEWSRSAGINYGRFSTWIQGDGTPPEVEFEQLAQAIGISTAELGEEIRNQAQAKTPVARFLEQLGLRYTHAHNKFVPSCIFELSREQIATFLKTLFTCDGSVYVNRYEMPGVSYSTISHQLAKDVQHLMLRFGFVCKLRTKTQRVNGKPYTAYEIQLLGISEIKRFLKEIGIHGRKESQDIIDRLSLPSLPSTGRDTIPTGQPFWKQLRVAIGNDTFADVGRRLGTRFMDRRHERPLSRYQVQRLASAYPDPYLDSLANGDVYWDEIESITPAGEEQVYDISVEGHANFVANDLIVHNSTLLASVTASMADMIGPALYISGEESTQQIKMRATRMGINSENLYLVTETNIDTMLQHVDAIRPHVLVVDSIQTTFTDTLDSTPGSVGQVKQCASIFQHLAKDSGMPVFLVGHVTKEGNIAGPRVLEHIVDTVLYLEGDAFQAFRLLRSVKNRFGATSEVGVFEMQGAGLIEVKNPSEAFLAERVVNAPGSAIAITMEGTRPILAEVQALATPTSFANPRRTANGIDQNRLLLLTAVLTRRVGMKLAEQDVFVNVIGGLRIDEPASDLAVAIALASSVRDWPVPADMAFVGEVGLSGELRAVSQLSARLNEAAKLGFKRVLIPKSLRRNNQQDDLPKGITAMPIRSLEEAIDVALR